MENIKRNKKYLPCITLHYIALHCITLHYIALHCITLNVFFKYTQH